MKRKIYVLLTRFPDNGSRVIEAVTGFHYTHASIGLEEDMNTFYSFVVKGFIVEKITRYVKPDREPYPCQLYELEVSERVYDRIKRIVGAFEIHKKSLRYSLLGVTLCLLHIPYRKKFNYFCSQFVAEVLGRSNAVALKKKSHLYLPGDFRHLPGMKLHFQGNLRDFIRRYALAPAGV